MTLQDALSQLSSDLSSSTPTIQTMTGSAAQLSTNLGAAIGKQNPQRES